ncbi:MAG TPA: type II toxin-antitoxin system RelE/ParE family toxin [Kiritimatiellia bacterium]|nr:type II toxin-antitoxin system RelE/ParE family toxin [Kiritimatiellia bacterium]HPS08792.1 type II toxin-antitoxin system RelE/ParE family toxin [Kiritimatiellia bacterium]
MGFDITFKKSVRKDLSKIPKALAARILDKIDEGLTDGDESFPVLKGEFAGLRKFRVGDYRVIYTILGSDVLVLHIAHRKDVYR